METKIISAPRKFFAKPADLAERVPILASRLNLATEPGYLFRAKETHSNQR